MTVELKHIIERIQTEAVGEARRLAEDIEARARSKGDAIVREAEARAAQIRERAHKDAEQSIQRGQAALEQAARDLLLGFARRLENMVNALLKERVAHAMDEQTMQALLVATVQSAASDAQASAAVHISPAEGEALLASAADALKTQMAQGLEMELDPRVPEGFQITLKDEEAHVEISRQALTDALALYLRPTLAEILEKVASEDERAS